MVQKFRPIVSDELDALAAPVIAAAWICGVYPGHLHIDYDPALSAFGYGGAVGAIAVSVDGSRSDLVGT